MKNKTTFKRKINVSQNVQKKSSSSKKTVLITVSSIVLLGLLYLIISGNIMRLWNGVRYGYWTIDKTYNLELSKKVPEKQIILTKKNPDYKFILNRDNFIDFLDNINTPSCPSGDTSEFCIGWNKRLVIYKSEFDSQPVIKWDEWVSSYKVRYPDDKNIDSYFSSFFDSQLERKRVSVQNVNTGEYLKYLKVHVKSSGNQYDAFGNTEYFSPDGDLVFTECIGMTCSLFHY